MASFVVLCLFLTITIGSLVRSLGGPSATLAFIESGAKKETLTQDQKVIFQYAVNAAKELSLEPLTDEQEFVPVVIALLFDHATEQLKREELQLSVAAL
jgi:hypothetical protein